MNGVFPLKSSYSLYIKKASQPPHKALATPVEVRTPRLLTDCISKQGAAGVC